MKDCSECLKDVPGVLWPWGDDLGAAHVERCDTCKRYDLDEVAADALRIKLGDGHFVAMLNYGTAENPDHRLVIVRDVRGSLQVLSRKTAMRILDEWRKAA